MKSNVAVLIGTRPGIIKMSPLIHEVHRRGGSPLVVHSGQHYSENMDSQIMLDVGLGEPDVHISRPEDSVTHAEQTAYMLTHIEDALVEHEPDVLLVCGDANTNLAGALAARKLHIEVGHVEAGLRSFDWRMPEEHNRVMIDHISEYLFAPTETSKRYLEDDGVQGEIFVVGNTVVDSALKHVERTPEGVEQRISALTGGEPYVLMTAHREENVDDPAVLRDILETLGVLGSTHDIPIVFPIHPRTRKRIREFDLEGRVAEMSHLKLIDPLGYLEFLAFLNEAAFVLTDSGGIQEESCILRTPCVTMRETTERPETVDVGANTIVGTEPEAIKEAFESQYDNIGNFIDWFNPYGDGKAAERIIDTCLHGSPKSEFDPDESQ